MGRALVSGLLRRGMLPEDIRVAEVSQEIRASLRRDFAVAAAEDPLEAVGEAPRSSSSRSNPTRSQPSSRH
jgi:pyrroline-5-carboxylate reductase